MTDREKIIRASLPHLHSWRVSSLVHAIEDLISILDAERAATASPDAPPPSLEPAGQPRER